MNGRAELFIDTILGVYISFRIFFDFLLVFGFTWSKTERTTIIRYALIPWLIGIVSGLICASGEWLNGG